MARVSAYRHYVELVDIPAAAFAEAAVFDDPLTTAGNGNHNLDKRLHDGESLEILSIGATPAVPWAAAGDLDAWKVLHGLAIQIFVDDVPLIPKTPLWLFPSGGGGVFYAEGGQTGTIGGGGNGQPVRGARWVFDEPLKITGKTWDFKQVAWQDNLVGNVAAACGVWYDIYCIHRGIQN